MHARPLPSPPPPDFEYSKLESTVGSHRRVNRFDYLGNGATLEEESEDGTFGDTAWYVTEPSVLLSQMGQVDGAHVMSLLAVSAGEAKNKGEHSGE